MKAPFAPLSVIHGGGDSTTSGKDPGTVPEFFYLFEDRSDGFHGRDWNEDGDSRGEFDLMVSFGGLERLDTQDYACLGFSSGFTFPLKEERRRAVDRLAELRNGNIGSFAQGDPFGPSLVGFRGCKARLKQDLLNNWDRNKGAP